MNQSPPDQDDKNPQNQTPVFDGNAPPQQNQNTGSYQDAMAESPDVSSPQLSPDIYSQEQSTPPPPPGENQDMGATPPPPFEEDNKRKYILIGAGILVFLVIVLLAVRFIFSRGGDNSKAVTLTYWGLWEDPNTIKPLIDEYQKSHPTVKINYTKQNPKEYRERLQAAINRGEGPDLFRFHNTWTDMLKNELSAIPESIYTKQEYENTFYPVAVEDLNNGNNIVGIPLEIDGLVVIYNEDILKASDIEVPTAWEDFRNAAIRLTVKDQSGTIQTAGVALGSADNVEHFSDTLGLMFMQNGADLYDLGGPCADPNSSTCATDTLLFYKRFAELPDNTWEGTFDNSIQAFAGGKVAMIFAPTWQILTIKQINPDINIKVAPVPQLPGITINWGTYWVEGVSPRSKNQLAAWEFLKFLSSKESMTKLYTEESKTRLFGEPYSRKDLASTLKNDPYLGVLMQEAPTMKSFPLASNTYDNGVNDQNIKYLLDAVNSMQSGASADSAVETLTQGLNQILEKFGYLPSTAAPESQ